MIAPLAGSALALERASFERFAKTRVGSPGADTLLYVASGLALFQVGEAAVALEPGMAALVLAGEERSLAALGDGIDLLLFTVGADMDLHAPMGKREEVVKPTASGAQQATGARSFRILFGPHNGSTRATLFAGFIPPGKAPWHYHLYDEIVWVPVGPGRLHLRDAVEELGPGSAFRLRPRRVHFTPAGTPSAAYLEPDIAADYRFAE